MSGKGSPGRGAYGSLADGEDVDVEGDGELAWYDQPVRRQNPYFLLFSFAFFLLAAGWRALMGESGFTDGFLDLEGIRRGVVLIALAALVGPVLARTLYMYALRHIDVSRAALVNQTQPLFVALFSAIALSTLPTRREWVGGILIVAGCLMLVRWTWKRRLPHR